MATGATPSAAKEVAVPGTRHDDPLWTLRDHDLPDGSDAPGRVWIPPVVLTDLNEETMHVLLWQVRGTTEIRMAGGTGTLSAGHALWMPAGRHHDLTVHENSVMMPLLFEVADTATTLHEPTMVAVDRDPRTLMLAYSSAWDTAIQHSVNLGRQILALIEDRSPLPGVLPMPRSEAARLIADALRFNPGDSRSTEELAASVHTSQRSIERAFSIRDGNDVAAVVHTEPHGDRHDPAPLARDGRRGRPASRIHEHQRLQARVPEPFGLSPTTYAQRYAAQ